MIDDKKREMLDQLAAQAMNALMLRHGTRIDNDRLAEKAYEVAAAMMEHRTRIHEEAKRMVAAQQRKMPLNLQSLMLDNDLNNT